MTDEEKEKNLKLEKRVRTSLMKQMKSAGRSAAFYQSMIDDYMAHWKIKQALIEDIEERGPIVTVTSGNGFTKTCPNESIMQLQKETATMLKILQSFDLRDPVAEVSSDDYL